MWHTFSTCRWPSVAKGPALQGPTEWHSVAALATKGGIIGRLVHSQVSTADVPRQVLL